MVLKSFLICFFLFLGTPHRVWGFSLERTQAYKNQIQQQKLFQHAQWLSLGHYHKTWSGSQKSKMKGHFFLATDGATNPEAELLATIDTLFTEATALQQCHYLARTRWLKSVLPIADEDLKSCPERDEWKKKLGAKEMYVVFASSDLSSPSSSFGHTFLRLHNPQNTHQLELLDYGVNYAATTGSDTGAIFGLKGLLGFYPGNYSMLPFHQKIREYTNLEGRDLWEYKLKLSVDDVEILVDHLLELDGSFSYYYFADENCSYQILELLRVARPDIDFTRSFYDFVIPLDTVKVLNQEHLLEHETSRPSMQAEWRRRYALLNLGQKKELRDLVKEPRKFNFGENLENKKKAEILEAGLSYLAIKEYREQKELKEDKYALALQRSKLGLITQPVEIPPPTSPLTSTDPVGIYLGYGKDQGSEFYDLKLRRAFHDLLGSDSGLSAFFHLEVMSFEFRYYSALKNLDLTQWTLINVLSTAPMTLLDHPLSWNIDIGTAPKLSPYMNVAVGSSFDLPLQAPSRWVILARSENQTQESAYRGFAGIQNLLIQSWSPYFRSLFNFSYLYGFDSRKYFWDQQVGVSFGAKDLEFRMIYNKRDEREQTLGSVIRYF